MLWVIEFVMDPATEENRTHLLFAPLPWTEGDRIEAALMVFESRQLAEAGLQHYLAWTAPEAEDPSYFLLPLEPWELLEMLQRSTPEDGVTHVTLNPILSRHFETAEGYSALYGVGDFIHDLRRTFDLE